MSILKKLFGTKVNKPDSLKPWESEAFERKHGLKPQVEIRRNGQTYMANLKTITDTGSPKSIILFNVSKITPKLNKAEYTAKEVDHSKSSELSVAFKKYLFSLSDEDFAEWLEKAQAYEEKEPLESSTTPPNPD